MVSLDSFGYFFMTMIRNVVQTYFWCDFILNVFYNGLNPIKYYEVEWESNQSLYFVFTFKIHIHSEIVQECASLSIHNGPWPNLIW